MLSGFELSFEAPMSVFLMYSMFYCSCLLAVFLVFFSSSQGSLVAMSGLGSLSNFFFFRLAIIVCLLALAGMPPLAGFFIKSFFFLFTISRGLTLSLLFAVFNLLSLYFYLSNTRLLLLNSGGRQADSYLTRACLRPRALGALTLVLLLLLLSPLFLDTFLVLSLSLLS